MKARLFPLWFHLLMGPKGVEAVPGTWWVLTKYLSNERMGGRAPEALARAT